MAFDYTSLLRTKFDERSIDDLISKMLIILTNLKYHLSYST